MIMDIDGNGRVLRLNSIARRQAGVRRRGRAVDQELVSQRDADGGRRDGCIGKLFLLAHMVRQVRHLAGDVGLVNGHFANGLALIRNVDEQYESAGHTVVSDSGRLGETGGVGSDG